MLQAGESGNAESEKCMGLIRILYIMKSNSKDAAGNVMELSPCLLTYLDAKLHPPGKRNVKCGVSNGRHLSNPLLFASFLGRTPARLCSQGMYTEHCFGSKCENFLMCWALESGSCFYGLEQNKRPVRGRRKIEV